MANRERGEVPLTVTGPDGTETTYTLRLSVNALCDLEERLSTDSHRVTFRELMARLAEMSIRDLRLVMFVALQEHHRDTFRELADVGELIQSAGGLTGILGQLQALGMTTAPDPEDQAEGPDGNPQPAQARRRSRGRGARATSSRAKSA